jgi:hypothetical protein
MAKKSQPNGPDKPADAREDRLKAALKANLARRKAQSRARTGEQTVAKRTPDQSRQNKDA